MSIPLFVDGETELDAVTLNRLVNTANGITDGTVPIALAGIADALEDWTSDDTPSRSQSLRGAATLPYWGPSEAVMVEDWGGRGNGSYDNGQHFVDMVAQAQAAGEGTSYNGIPIRFGSGVYATSLPLILPRSESTPEHSVHVLGNGIRATRLYALSSFPANRGMIEWEAVEKRVWHGRIANLNFLLPSVAGVKAIWHKRIGTGTTAVSTWTEWFNCDMENLLFEGSNTYHEVFVDLEIGNRSAVMLGLYGDPSRGADPIYSTILVRTATDFAGTPLSDTDALSDSIGIGFCRCQNWYSMIRRGGYARMFEGRAYSSSFSDGFGQGASAIDNAPVWDVRDSCQVEFSNIAHEGNAELAQLRFNRCVHVNLATVGLGTPDSTDSAWVANTAYSLGDRVVPTTLKSSSLTPINHVYVCTVAGTSHATTEPTWPTGSGATVADNTVTWTESGPGLGDGIVLEDCQHITWTNRLVIPGAQRFSGRDVSVITVDADCYNIKASNINFRIVGGGAAADELDIHASATDIEITGYTHDGTSWAPYTFSQ